MSGPTGMLPACIPSRSRGLTTWTLIVWLDKGSASRYSADEPLFRGVSIQAGEGIQGNRPKWHRYKCRSWPTSQKQAHYETSDCRHSASSLPQKVLELSAKHFLPVGQSGGDYRQATMKQARDVVPGDLVFATQGNDLQAQEVTDVTVVSKQGLWAPYTSRGTIVVNGVVASVHSEWILDGLLETLGRPDLLPAIYQVSPGLGQSLSTEQPLAHSSSMLYLASRTHLEISGRHELVKSCLEARELGVLSTPACPSTCDQ